MGHLPCTERCSVSPSPGENAGRAGAIVGSLSKHGRKGNRTKTGTQSVQKITTMLIEHGDSPISIHVDEFVTVEQRQA